LAGLGGAAATDGQRGDENHEENKPNLGNRDHGGLVSGK
jgi:hypothetical protein